MLHKTTKGLAILALTLVVAGDKYLAQKPDFLKPCKLTDSGFDQCLAKGYQIIFSEYKNGIPGLKGLGSIDPLHVKRITINEKGNNAISLNIVLSNVLLEGLRNTQVNEANFDKSKYMTKAKYTLPDTTLKFDYEVEGRILSLPMNGKGKGEMKIQNLKIDVDLKFKLREEDGFKFTDVEKARVLINDVGGFHFNLENLFNGQKDLENSANELLNTSWMEIFQTLRPSIRTTIQTILEDRFKRVFGHIPGTYFIEDL
uniref:Hemolymph juvenile hormone binding protein (JHBP) n=1 Tax=Musca domestica TaxID=7370 RepID=A0A1I8MSL5_MUSDO